jgi:hypothetical protein
VILLAEALNGLSVVLLPAAAALLLEELTYGGLVRLMLAPKPGTGDHGATGGKALPAGGRRAEPNQGDGGGKCSH